MAQSTQGTWACSFPLIQTIINFSMERKEKSPRKKRAQPMQKGNQKYKIYFNNKL